MSGACRRTWFVTSLAAIVAASACTPPAPQPAPAPARTTPARAAAADSARADSARARARADSARVARAVPPPAPPPPPPGRFASVARPSRRTDTLATRTLRAPFRVCAGGDVTLGTNLDTTWAQLAKTRMLEHFGRADDPESLIAPLRPMFRGADVALVNVESAVGEGSAPSKCGPTSTKCFAFRAPLATGRALRSLAPRRIVVGNLANNHSHDAGNAGQDSTIAALTRAGILVTGDDTLPTLVRLPSGDTIAVLGFYTSRETPDARDTAAVRRHVARAADNFPVVIVTMHLGAEGREAQRARDSTELYLGFDRGNPLAFADAAIRGGAALVVGHGPHVLRAMEWRERGALIAYSLGNLLTYGPFVLKEPLNRGAVLCATIGRSARVTSATLVPTMQRAPGVLERDRKARAYTLVDSLGRLDFPATGARVNARGAVRPRPLR